MLNALRRALLAVAAAGIVAAVLKSQGSNVTPPLKGGWRELSGPEFR